MPLRNGEECAELGVSACLRTLAEWGGFTWNLIIPSAVMGFHCLSSPSFNYFTTGSTLEIFSGNFSWSVCQDGKQTI